MDDTHQSRQSDAAATRKRRSSILKSQRPRAPFSELEFRVTTPPDAAKSRRVSFSRRTGVAEFATNEATTTWKNFYEEHNKTLESSGNESEIKARPPIGHIGKSLLFEQQFQEVEAIDLIASLDDVRGRPLEISSNPNFTQQFAALECTSEGKLTMPRQQFELSAFTDQQSKMFGDDLALSGVGKVTDQMSVNFSNLQAIGGDDLDAMEKDLQLAFEAANAGPKFVCPGPSIDRNMSEYIEVDLNTTSAVIRDDQSDMSITDTIHSPKVNVSKTNSISNTNDRSLIQDWIADKENIIVNPYVAPKESANFAINEDPDKVLVFDGKRLTLESEKKQDFRKTLLLNAPDKIPQRKTIVLNVNDDLPNFVDDPYMSMCQGAKSFNVSNKTICDNDLSMTQPVPNNIETNTEKRNTIVYENDMDNISMTQAIPTNIIGAEKEKHRTIVYESDSADISVTQAVPTNLSFGESTEKRKTIHYEDGAGNISITQSLPTNFILQGNTNTNKEKRRTILFETDSADISVTQAVPSVILPMKNEKRKTIVFEDDVGNISITQAVPASLILSEKPEVLKAAAHEVTSGDISMTQVVPSSILLENSEPERRKTIVYENDAGNISITQALPANILPSAQTEKRQTIVFETDSGNVSVTQAVPTNLILSERKKSPNSERPSQATSPNLSNLEVKENKEKRKTIVYEDDACNISIIRAIPTNIILSDVDKKTALTVETSGTSISVVESRFPTEKRKTMVYDNDSNDISITQAVPANILMDKTGNLSKNSYVVPISGNKEGMNIEAPLDEEKQYLNTNLSQMINAQEDSKMHSMLYDNNFGNMSMTKPIPTDILSMQAAINKSNFDDLISSKEMENIEQSFLVYKASTEKEKKSPKKGKLDNTMPIQLDFDEVTNSPSIIKVVKPVVEEVQPQASTASDSKHGSVKDESETKKSFLENLLDMSNASMEGGLDRDPKFKVYADKTKEPLRRNTESNQSLLGSEIKSEIGSHITLTRSNPSVIEKLKNEMLSDLDVKLQELQLKQAAENMNIVANSRNLSAKSSYKDLLEVKKPVRSCKEADNTKDLLEMLTELTDQDDGKSAHTERMQDETIIKPVSRRQSMITREDLLTNISMAQAVLQKSRAELDESGATDPTPEETPSERSPPLKKSVRLSDEVVKTLHFEEDDTYNIEEPKKEFKGSPLRKRLSFNTNSPPLDTTKANVIPSYLKDVSDGVKQLMTDLVKPMTDTLPFQNPAVEKHPQRIPSTCSTQIQANLTTSSQIDLNDDNPGKTSRVSILESRETIPEDPEMLPGIRETLPELANVIRKAVKGAVDFILPSHDTPEESIIDSERASVRIEEKASVDSRVDSVMERSYHRAAPDHVLVFDHENPLNNVLIGPMDFSEVHRYDPIPSSETLVQPSRTVSQSQSVTSKTSHLSTTSQRSKSINEDCEYRVERLETKLISDTETSGQAGDACTEKPSDMGSIASTKFSADQSVEALTMEQRNAEVNTLIVMKGNRELLDASSSLTLVEDNRDPEEIEGEAPMDTNSPVRVIYKIPEHDPTDKTDSEMTSNDEMLNIEMNKSKKRNYSPAAHDKHKYCTISSLEETPKPIKKMFKFSSSPNTVANYKSKKAEKVGFKDDLLEEFKEIPATSSSEPEHSETQDENSSIVGDKKKKKSHKKVKVSPKNKKGGATITVQQVLTEYRIQAQDKDVKSSSNTETDESLLQPSSQGALEGVSSGSSCERFRGLGSETTESPMDWHPELINELSSKNLVTECDSSVNVVAKIDMLPFMGSGECEWEWSGGDAWWFRLLQGRLRLRVHLAHRHHNAPRSRVLADTPVLDVTLHAAALDKTNTVGALCIEFAEAGMRYWMQEGCTRAGDVPALVRRCAGIARVALRWGRAMADAKIRLAYTLQGREITLKVANIPLRSVWEVSMCVMMSGGGREPPHPAAGEARARVVVADCEIRQDELTKIVASVKKDWGHVPRSLWKIFRYLKNKTRDDALLGL